jgi:catechol 1,2-dioxygenase
VEPELRQNLWAKVEHKDYKPLTTQIFDRNCKHLKDDALFAVKDSLMLDFAPRHGDPKATLEASFDVKLIPL